MMVMMALRPIYSTGQQQPMLLPTTAQPFSGGALMTMMMASHPIHSPVSSNVLLWVAPPRRVPPECCQLWCAENACRHATFIPRLKYPAPSEPGSQAPVGVVSSAMGDLARIRRDVVFCFFPVVAYCSLHNRGYPGWRLLLSPHQREATGLLKSKRLTDGRLCHAPLALSHHNEIDPASTNMLLPDSARACKPAQPGQSDILRST